MYGGYISKLKRYFRVCVSCDFLDREMLLTRKLNVRHHGLVYHYARFVSLTATYMFRWLQSNVVPLWLITECLALVTRSVPLVGQQLFTLPKHPFGFYLVLCSLCQITYLHVFCSPSQYPLRFPYKEIFGMSLLAFFYDFHTI